MLSKKNNLSRKHQDSNGLWQPQFVASIIANTRAKNGYKVELFVNKEVDQTKTEEILRERIFSSVKIVVKPTFLQPRGILDLYQIMLLYGSRRCMNLQVCWK